MTYIGIIFRRTLHGDAKNTVLKIGNIKVPIRDAKRPELVPTGFADKNLPPSLIHAIKWLIQKDALQQDVFLIGVPGYLRSFVVFSYLDLTNREFEYLSVTRDTTEADIKQRREINGGNAFYSDLCAVRAALNGRVLVIDGVEKAERNVLPILNNLLENREMQLDDGRFLMAARKYDKLREKYSEEELQKMKLERVSENFHVIALGLPVPTFKGHTLDPPLRSRFQCRNISELPFETMSQLCSFIAPNVGNEKVNNLLALVYGLNSQNTEKTGIALPLYPIDNLLKSMKIWNLNPSLPEETIFNLSYPKNSILKEENQLPILEEFFQNFSTQRESKNGVSASIKDIEISNNNSATISTKFDGKDLTFSVPAGSFSELPKKHEFVSTKAHESLLANLLLTHSTADFCLLGPRGSGKSTIIEEFSRRLGYETETIVLYQDMNSRELIQQRRMLSNGDTVWEDSQLIRAAKKGALCILDGLEKIHWSTAEMLGPLIHHRCLQLPDGSRLIGSMYYDAIKAKTGFTDELLAQKGVYKISENFRLIALADSESINSSKWLNEQILSMFLFHNLKPMSIREQCEVIARLIPNVNKDVAHRLVSLVERLRASTDAGIRGIAISLSLRRLIYILRRFTQNPDEGVFNAIHRSALSRFMPTITRTAFEKALTEAGIGHDSKSHATNDESWKERLLETSKKSATSDSVEHESMVPDIVFFDNKQHLKVMNDMAKDFELGSHLLVIGNQGVGKNKITDRFLQLIQRPRQYMQLHRDTTVQSLTVQSTVVDGILKHEDSPLVKAVRDGLVLVIDEGDKAPLHVVAVLKSLIDSGILYLSDGRRIQPAGFPVDPVFKPITIHPDFRLIMLANRPGFPFLGNDLFAVLGDLFSIHVVDNPSRSSELAMLKQYGPNVKDEHLQQLVSAFDELREMADNSLLSYPYSTRELVNIVKHLQVYPDDPLTVVVRNVFDFDSYTKETTQSIEAVFQKYGIPLGIKKPEENVFLSPRFPIEEPRKIGEWKIKENTKPFLIEPKIVPLIAEKEFNYKKYAFNLEMHHSRASMFSEQKFFWQLPTSDVNICSDILEIGNGRICVATVNPQTLYYIPDQRKPSCVEIDLSQQFSKFTRGEYQPRFTLANWNSTGVLIHEETTNTLLMVDFEKLKIYKLGNEESTVLDSIVGKFTAASISNGTNHWRLVNHSERPILFNRGGNEIQILFPGDLPAGAEIITLPDGFSISNILSASKDKFLIATNKGTFLLTFESDGRVFLRPLTEDSDIPLHFDSISKMQLDNDNSNPSFILTHEDYYALKSENFPELMSAGEVFAWKRPSAERKNVQEEVPYRSLKEKFPLIHPQKEVVIFENGVIVRALPKWKTPDKALPKNVSPTAISGFLEVVDPRRNNVQYIPVPATRLSLYHSSWVASITKAPFTICKGSDGKSLYTCETNGAIRKWEIDEIELMSSLQAWHKLFGTEDPNERIEYERDESQIDMSKLTESTLGKYDPKNTPHVGGNQWMGGTGGYNTAGLGGVGGPFRLDAGHDVHQIHEDAKSQVPEEYKRKAREINRKEYQKRLKDIDMSEHDAETYETFKEKIKKQVTHMKSIIDSLEARERERQWMKHQTSGDLDDAKLIEGLTGEKGIYRRRMEQPPEPGAIQTKPKRLRLVFDVSGSMYRFNGHDKRLQKSMEAALMVMEALDGKQDKIKYDIVGHSGDGPEMIFTTPDKPPSNEKQKFDVAKKMLLQSQFCYSGDYTLEALQMAISKISKESDVDERFVIVLSDANLDRYGIKPHHLAKQLEADPKVHAFVILVGSLGAQAEKLVKALPAGKAFYASDTAQLPHIIQNIFASTLIK